ncbi:putative holin-like toxin [Veillonella sp.]
MSTFKVLSLMISFGILVATKPFITHSDISYT